MASKDYVAKTAYHGDVASHYDEHRTVQAVWALEQEFVEKWAETRSPGTSVLDIPAGTGRFLGFFLARRMRVHAWDISEDMLTEIRRRYPAVPASELDVRVGDAENLPLPAEAVEHVVSWRFFHLIPGPVMDGVLREFRRVARGTVIVQVFAVRPAGTQTTLWQAVKNRLRPLWRRLRPAGPEPWAHIASYSHREEDLLAAFARAGFAVAQTHTLGVFDGLPTRVYFLERAVAGGGRGAGG